MMIEEVEGGGWVATASWGRVSGVFPDRDAALAVSKLPVPSTQRLLEEAAYWKEQFHSLLADVEAAGVPRQIPTYRYTGARAPGPLERYVLSAAIKAQFAKQKVAREPEPE